MVVMVVVGMRLRTLENTWQFNVNFEEAEECLGQQFSELKSYMLWGLPIVAVSTFLCSRNWQKWMETLSVSSVQASFQRPLFIYMKKFFGRKKIDYIYCWIMWPGFLSFNPHKNVWVHYSWKSPWELSSKGSNEFTLRRSFSLRSLALDLRPNLINATLRPLWTSLYMSAPPTSPCPASHGVTSGEQKKTQISLATG